jgi:hypothetical protein
LALARVLADARAQPAWPVGLPSREELEKDVDEYKFWADLSDKLVNSKKFCLLFPTTKAAVDRLRNEGAPTVKLVEE